MVKLEDIASMIMDLYGQEFPTDDEYFDLADFIFIAAAAYSKIVMDYYDQAKMANRAENGNSQVEISPGWLVTKKLKPSEGKKFTACIDFDIFTFPNDSMDTGIQEIRACDCSKCGDFIKIAPSDAWQVKYMPGHRAVKYYRIGRVFQFLQNANCSCKEIELVYLPALTSADAEAEIPEVLQTQMLTVGLQLMIAAKQGNVAKETNDSNANKVPGAEVDQSRLK